MNEIKIDIVPISELRPYEKNARKHQSEDIGAIVASIKEFGFNDPIGVWSDENIIVEGHGRLEAAKALGLEVVPVIHLDHLSDEQRRAYALAHNKTAELSLWDFELLDSELDNILDIDMSEFGFDLGEDDAGETEKKEATYNENISVVIDCDNEEEAEQIFMRLKSEGYNCRVSTL